MLRTLIEGSLARRQDEERMACGGIDIAKKSDPLRALASPTG